MSRPTPHLGHRPIKMHLVESVRKLRQRGDFCWSETDGGTRLLHLMVPSDYANGTCYTRWKIAQPLPSGVTLLWDGNREKPTIKPELNARTVWRGKVSSGMLIEAPRK